MSATGTVGVLVPHASVVDTTAAPEWVPVRVTARLADPIVGWAEQPAALDGPVSWGAYLAAVEAGVQLPPIGPEWAVDFALPIATWTRPIPAGAAPDPRLLAADGTVWGWACSRAQYAADAHTSVDIRRKPPAREMAQFTQEKKHHLGLGPFKARSVALPAVDVREVHWYALARPTELQPLLARVTHLGRHTRHGHGRVLDWDVTEDQGAVEGWAERSFPVAGGRPDAVRAPYWHASRRLPCL